MRGGLATPRYELLAPEMRVVDVDVLEHEMNPLFYLAASIVDGLVRSGSAVISDRDEAIAEVFSALCEVRNMSVRMDYFREGTKTRVTKPDAGPPPMNGDIKDEDE